MVLTEQDAENADKIYELANVRSKAHAVGVALSVARFVADAIDAGSEVILKNKAGETDRVIFPDLRRRHVRAVAPTAAGRVATRD